MKDMAKGKAKSGEQVLVNRKVQGHASNRRPDVQIVNRKGKTREIHEAERSPNSKRNREREAEYKKLKIKNKTHPLE